MLLSTHRVFRISIGPVSMVVTVWSRNSGRRYWDVSITLRCNLPASTNRWISMDWSFGVYARHGETRTTP